MIYKFLKLPTMMHKDHFKRLVTFACTLVRSSLLSSSSSSRTACNTASFPSFLPLTSIDIHNIVNAEHVRD